MSARISNYTQEVTIPSKGYLNPEIPNGTIVQRCMMVSDQKFLAGSQLRGSLMTKTLLERTIESPENIDIGKLTPADTLYLLFKLRVLSYGSSYKFRTKCPECGQKIDLDVDLSTLVVNTLEEDYEKHMEVVLPNAGDKVYTRFVTNDDMSMIEDEMERRRRKGRETTEDSEFVLRLASMIKKIELVTPNADGDKVLTHPIDIQNYLEDLTDLDATAIRASVDKVSFGISPLVEERCPHCREFIDVGITFGGGFFRPKYDL